MTCLKVVAVVRYATRESQFTAQHLNQATIAPFNIFDVHVSWVRWATLHFPGTGCWPEMVFLIKPPNEADGKYITHPVYAKSQTTYSIIVKGHTVHFFACKVKDKGRKSDLHLFLTDWVRAHNASLWQEVLNISCQPTVCKLWWWCLWHCRFPLLKFSLFLVGFFVARQTCRLPSTVPIGLYMSIPALPGLN